MQGELGRFVVLEGIDGSGTTTQVARLAERLRAMRVPVRATREPSEGPIGTLIRQILSGRLIVPGGSAPGWTTMALLFAADRMDHIESDIAPFVASGGVVVSDRYDASSLAYQSISSGADSKNSVEWIRALNRYARRPDLTIVLDLEPEQPQLLLDEVSRLGFLERELGMRVQMPPPLHRFSQACLCGRAHAATRDTSTSRRLDHLPR